MRIGFWIGFTLFHGLILGYILQFSRIEQMWLVNTTHSEFGDQLFLLLSFSAEIVFPLGLSLYTFFKKRDSLIPLILTYLSVTFVIQFLKLQLFPDFARPDLYFSDQIIDFYKIKGQIIHQRNSFPSGHTGAAWWIVFWLVQFFAKNNFQAFLFCFYGFGVALSRVYLFQHFPVDTLAGGIISIGIAYISLKFYQKKYA